ncbi:MAG: hypothetical protein KF802_07700 [Bdellovibrionaceae bacterium]|nr:hypothetical protein [Pseudobdellovibrionaceae bacterium]
MMEASSKKDLSQVSDAEILEEAAERLKRQYLSEHGVEFRFGSFHFVFHDGRFQAVEDWPRSRRYLSPKRVAGNKE